MCVLYVSFSNSSLAALCGRNNEYFIGRGKGVVIPVGFRDNAVVNGHSNAFLPGGSFYIKQGLYSECALHKIFSLIVYCKFHSCCISIYRHIL